jgi:hypothetical protein
MLYFGGACCIGECDALLHFGLGAMLLWILNAKHAIHIAYRLLNHYAIGNVALHKLSAH